MSSGLGRAAPSSRHGVRGTASRIPSRPSFLVCVALLASACPTSRAIGADDEPSHPTRQLIETRWPGPATTMTASRARWDPAANLGRLPAAAEAGHDQTLGHTTSQPPLEPRSLCIKGRQAPTVFILGCNKCGTTSITRQMQNAFKGRAMRVATGKRLEGEPVFYEKEKHFFDIDANFAKGFEWYLSHFPPCTAPAAVILDATPDYLRTPSVPQRLAQAYGEHRKELTFIVILRDPVRAMVLAPLSSARPGLSECTQLQRVPLLTCTSAHIHTTLRLPACRLNASNQPFIMRWASTRACPVGCTRAAIRRTPTGCVGFWSLHTTALAKTGSHFGRGAAAL